MALSKVTALSRLCRCATTLRLVPTNSLVRPLRPEVAAFLRFDRFVSTSASKRAGSKDPSKVCEDALSGAVGGAQKAASGVTSAGRRFVDSVDPWKLKVLLAALAVGGVVMLLGPPEVPDNSWRHMTFVGRKITFEDFVAKYLAQTKLTQLHYFTDNRVWVERMYETDLRRWITHFEREFNKEIDGFLKQVSSTKIKIKDPPPAKKEKKVEKAAAADKKGDKKEEPPKPMTSAEAKNKLQKVGQIMSVAQKNRRLRRNLRKIVRILEKCSSHSQGKVQGLVDMITKKIKDDEDFVRKTVPELEKDLLVKPLTEAITRITTADEMLRVFEEINEIEHVFVPVESRQDFQKNLEDAMKTLQLPPARRVGVRGHNYPSIEVVF